MADGHFSFLQLCLKHNMALCTICLDVSSHTRRESLQQFSKKRVHCRSEVWEPGKLAPSTMSLLHGCQNTWFLLGSPLLLWLNLLGTDSYEESIHWNVKKAWYQDVTLTLTPTYSHQTLHTITFPTQPPFYSNYRHHRVFSGEGKSQEIVFLEYVAFG